MSTADTMAAKIARDAERCMPPLIGVTTVPGVPDLLREGRRRMGAAVMSSASRSAIKEQRASLFDSRCLDLAEYFLKDEPACSLEPADLAAEIQQLIEDRIAEARHG
jgi:hypothetical protein